MHILRAALRTGGRAGNRVVQAVADGRCPARRSLREGLFGAVVPVVACMTMLVGLTAWTKAGAAGSPARIDVGVGRVLLPAAGKERTTAFFRIANTGEADDQLVAVTSPVADEITLNRHERVGEEDETTRTVSSANIPAGDFVVMTSATLDLGVTVRTRRRVGDAMPFVLHFRRSGPVDAVAFVVRPGG